MLRFKANRGPQAHEQARHLAVREAQSTGSGGFDARSTLDTSWAGRAGIGKVRVQLRGYDGSDPSAGTWKLACNARYGSLSQLHAHVTNTGCWKCALPLWHSQGPSDWIVVRILHSEEKYREDEESRVRLRIGGYRQNARFVIMLQRRDATRQEKMSTRTSRRVRSE